MFCRECKKQAPLILNVCADCDPELHKAWDEALKSSIDFETVTPEIQAAFTLVEARKAQMRRQ